MIDYTEFVQRLNRTKTLSSKAKDLLFEGVRNNRFDASETFVSPGNHANSIYYIQSGIVRGAIEGPKEKITTWFKQEGDIIIPQGMFLQQVSEEYISTVIKTNLLSVSLNHIYKVIVSYPEAAELLLLLADEKVMEGQNREKMLRFQAAKDRYNYIEKNEPFLLRRVPNFLIASYLNVTKETFSRIHKGLPY